MVDFLPVQEFYNKALITREGPSACGSLCCAVEGLEDVFLGVCSTGHATSRRNGLTSTTHNTMLCVVDVKAFLLAR
jgi:hypothetical protein